MRRFYVPQIPVSTNRVIAVQAPALSMGALAPTISQASNPTLAWNASSQSLTAPPYQNSAFSLDFDTQQTGAIPAGYALLSGALPAGTALSGARQNLWSGTPTTQQTVTPVIRSYDAVEWDWRQRSTAAGVTFATDFSNATTDFDQTAHVFGANQSPSIAYWKSLVTQYLADTYLPSAVKIASPASTGANGASWITTLNPVWTSKTQGFSTTGFYVSVRTKFPASRLIQRAGGGFKFMDISAYDPQNPQASISHTNFEIVTQNVGWHQIPICYREVLGSPENGGSGGQVPFAQSFDATKGDIVVQDIDRGSGTNIQRYCLYNSGQYGLVPDGCWDLFTDEWISHKWFVQITTYGGATSNRFKYWSARQGASAWTLVYDQTNFNIGNQSDGYTNAFCGLHLNAYETGYDGSGSTDTYQLWSQLLVSTQDIALCAANA